MLVEASLLEMHPNFGHSMIVFTLGIRLFWDEGILLGVGGRSLAGGSGPARSLRIDETAEVVRAMILLDVRSHDEKCFVTGVSDEKWNHMYVSFPRPEVSRSSIAPIPQSSISL